MGRTLVYVGGAVVAGGIAFAGYSWAYGDRHTLKELPPDEPSVVPTPPSPGRPGRTGYRLVDTILPKLSDIAQSTGIPLGLMVGWVALESGGKLSSTTSLDERGYYQLMPAESKQLGLDHQRLSTDSNYSLDAGTKIIRQYQQVVNDLNVPAAPAGSSFYWRLVKLAHTVGSGQTKKLVKAATAAGRMGSWDDFETYCLSLHVLGPQPKKWLPFIDKLYALGKPFGFGDDRTVSSKALLVVGAADRAPRGLLGIDLLVATERRTRR